MTQSAASDFAVRSRTKIVATVGPACSSEPQLEELILAGVDVFRLNMAHGELTEHAQRLTTIRSIAQRLQHPVAVLIDLAGPKIRLGELPNGQIDCQPGTLLRFVRGDTAAEPSDLVTTYPRLIDELEKGDRVLLADGTVRLVVLDRTEDHALCGVEQAGLIRSRQGVNLPGVKLSVAALSDVDRKNAIWAARAGVDFISLSFVRSPQEIHDLKGLIRENGSSASVVAKIEKPEALEKLESIVAATDVVMVARGDLGVEIDVARMPIVQKEIVACSHRHQKPVIIATQMLDSMQHSLQPTRAEVTDVANAILDGGDACMLSGETAIGKYPRHAVEMMHRIAMATEPQFRARASVAAPEFSPAGLHQITQAVVVGASLIARQLDARLMVVSSQSGATALALSKMRNFVPTIGVSGNEATLRQMCLYWGVTPLPGAPTDSSFSILKFVADWGKRQGCLASGDRILLARGTNVVAGVYNLLMVHQVE